ncbi:MAG TPA: M48 family metallopeptidase [Micromonosporaceae bacterium]|jgi:Zn-dependent protease with chaperone function|nr:M48 family metallopeptidase [Micromonosporaceae bacterium]
MTENVPTRRRIVLTGISSRAWEHPADRGALTALREMRGFDEVLKAIAGVWNDRAWRLMFLGGSIRVDHRQHPRVHRIFAEAAATLDIDELPELYVGQNPMLNAGCVGMSKPFITLTSRSVELLDDDELRYVLGHELGHLRSGHAVYRTMMLIIRRMIVGLAWLPVGAIVLRGIEVALMEWWRKAELSADRAGLLAGQDPAAALRAHMKLAGGGDLSEIDTAAFLEQAQEYDSSGDLRDSMIKLMMTIGLTHPLPVARAAALRSWIDSGAYARILSGDYPRRETDRDASIRDDAREAAESYRDTFRHSQDPLVGLLRKLGDGAAGVGDVVGAGASRVRGWMGGRGQGTNGTSQSGSTDGSSDEAQA